MSNPLPILVHVVAAARDRLPVCVIEHLLAIGASARRSYQRVPRHRY